MFSCRQGQTSGNNIAKKMLWWNSFAKMMITKENVPRNYCVIILTRMAPSNIANLLSPYSIQNRSKPQIYQKFVPAIVLESSSQGHWNLSKICQNPKKSHFPTCFDKFWQISVSLTGTLKNNRWDKFLMNLGFGTFLNAVRLSIIVNPRWGGEPQSENCSTIS